MAGSPQTCTASPVPPLSAPSRAPSRLGRGSWRATALRASGPARPPRLLHGARGQRVPQATGGGPRSLLRGHGVDEKRQRAGLSEAGRGPLHGRCRGSGPPHTWPRTPGVQPWVRAAGLLGKFSQAARDGSPQLQATQNRGRAGLGGDIPGSQPSLLGQGLGGRGLGAALASEAASPPPPQSRHIVISPQGQSETSCLLPPRGGAAHLCREGR